MNVTLNDKSVAVSAPHDQEPLIWWLSDVMQLNGARYGCGEGHCGSCSVLVNGQAQRSCQLTPTAVAGQRVTTLEGLGTEQKPHAVQRAFLENPLQCSYCMTGHMMAIASLLATTQSPSEVLIDEAIAVNLCRCGGYGVIKQNALRTIALMKEGA
jgi:aerobic-type carbon monoxide dehydrogenase small subunit (CoxS/CutS family)